MKLKTKLASFVFAFALLLSMSIVGVLAVTESSFGVSGSIIFKTEGIEATISNGTASGLTVDKTMEEVVITQDSTSEELDVSYSSWKGMTVNLEEEVATIKFSITNDKEESNTFPYMRVEVGVTASDLTNADIQVTNNMGGQAIYLAPGASADYTISLYINDLAKDVDVSSFQINFGLDRMTTTPNKSSIQLSYDADRQYYYVEMGTYNSESVKWRLASFDGVNRFNATSLTPPIMYTPIDGDTIAYQNATFVQETVAMQRFFDDIEFEYSVSGIRSYLRNTSVASDGTSFMGDLGISSTNTIYKNIQARYGGENWNVKGSLNVDILYDCRTKWLEPYPPADNDGYPDNFWLLSVGEAWTLLGGGRMIPSNVEPESKYVDWSDSEVGDEETNMGWRGEYYWLRSWCSDCSLCYYVCDDGTRSDSDPDTDFYIRAGFLLNF